MDNHWDTFAPRVGFAFDLTGRQKTILRGGAGLFYERLAGNEMYNLGQNTVPFAYQSNPSNVYLDNPATSWTNGQTASSPYFPASINALANPYKTPTAPQWSLGIQQQLSENCVLTVTYVGNSNYHQSEGTQHQCPVAKRYPTAWAFAAARAVTPERPLNANLYRPYLGWGTISPMFMSRQLQLPIAAGQLPDHGVAQPHLQYVTTPGRTPSTLSTANSSPTSTIPSTRVGTTVPPVLTGVTSLSPASSTTCRSSRIPAPGSRRR